MASFQAIHVAQWKITQCKLLQLGGWCTFSSLLIPSFPPLLFTYLLIFFPLRITLGSLRLPEFLKKNVSLYIDVGPFRVQALKYSSTVLQTSGNPEICLCTSALWKAQSSVLCGWHWHSHSLVLLESPSHHLQHSDRFVYLKHNTRYHAYKTALLKIPYLVNCLLIDFLIEWFGF